MTRLTSCRSCGAKIATNANACPKCGAHFNRISTNSTAFILMLALVGLFILVLAPH
jgi:predicted amidophosphoribosyltransferase